MFKNKTTVSRWVDIFFYAVIAYFIVSLLSHIPLFTRAFSWWSKTFGSLACWQKLTLGFSCGVLLMWMLRYFKIWHAERSCFWNWTYPPLVISPILVFIFLIISNFSSFLSMVSIAGVAPVFFFLCGVFTALCYMTWTKKNTQPHLVSPTSVSLSSVYDWEYEHFQNWFTSDSPIESVEDLQPELQPYVARLVDKLNGVTKPDEKRSLQIALCGKFGVGKSSVVKCVQAQLNSEQWVMANINIWGRDRSNVNGQILGVVIEKLAKHIDVVGLKQLPAQYYEALKAGNTTSKVFAALTTSFEQPERLLKRLDQILICTNKHLLINVEDVDRGPNFEELCHDLASLLDRLKGRRNIHFIVSLEYSKTSAEMIRKVCTYREDIAVSQPRDILCAWLLNCYVRAEKTGMKMLTAKPEIVNGKFHYGYARDSVEKISSLIRSLRTYKHIIRRLDFIWHEKRLMGEVDLYSLFLLIVLREEEPPIFNFIAENSGAFVNWNEKNRIFYEEKELKFPNSNTGNKAWGFSEKLVQTFPEHLDVGVMTSLLETLFSRAGLQAQKLINSVETAQYFNRIVNEAVVGELKDQELFNALAVQKPDWWADKISTDLRYLHGFERFYKENARWKSESLESLESSQTLIIMLLKKYQDEFDKQKSDGETYFPYISDRQKFYKKLYQHCFDLAAKINTQEAASIIIKLLAASLNYQSLLLERIISYGELMIVIRDLSKTDKKLQGRIESWWFELLRGGVADVELPSQQMFRAITGALISAKGAERPTLGSYECYYLALLNRTNTESSRYKARVKLLVIVLEPWVKWEIRDSNLLESLLSTELLFDREFLLGFLEPKQVERFVTQLENLKS